MLTFAVYIFRIFRRTKLGFILCGELSNSFQPSTPIKMSYRISEKENNFFFLKKKRKQVKQK